MAACSGCGHASNKGPRALTALKQLEMHERGTRELLSGGGLGAAQEHVIDRHDRHQRDHQVADEGHHQLEGAHRCLTSKRTLVLWYAEAGAGSTVPCNSVNVW